MSDANKVTSLGTSSGTPTPPHPTPRTDASSGVDEPPETDMNAVAQVLAPIQESLNEKADVALMPSPPANTPLSYSPAPSLYKGGRSRGLSGINDRLMQLKLEHPSQYASPASSNPSLSSVPASVRENDAEDNDEVGSQDSCVNEQVVVPEVDRRIQELIKMSSFSAAELPVSDPDNSGTSSTVVALAGDTSGESSSAEDGGVVIFVEPDLCTKDVESEDVVEKSNWAEEVMDYVDRALKQLEQLAEDQARVDTTHTIQKHFITLINQVLQAEHRHVRCEAILKE